MGSQELHGHTPDTVWTTRATTTYMYMYMYINMNTSRIKHNLVYSKHVHASHTVKHRQGVQWQSLGIMCNDTSSCAGLSYINSLICELRVHVHACCTHHAL